MVDLKTSRDGGKTMIEDLRVKKTIRDIQNGFIEVLETKSFEKITVNDICNASLIGRSTFYHHYQDKYDLLDQMNRHQAKKFNQLLFQRIQDLDKDELQINLYNGLVSDRKIIIALVSVNNVDNNLKSAYFKLLKKYFSEFSPEIKVDVPDDFLSDLYANTALMAILWSLKHGHQEEIAKFMNEIVRKLIF